MENTHGQEARAATSGHLYSSKEWQNTRNLKKKLQQWSVVFAIGHSDNASS